MFKTANSSACYEQNLAEAYHGNGSIFEKADGELSTLIILLVQEIFDILQKGFQIVFSKKPEPKTEKYFKYPITKPTDEPEPGLPFIGFPTQ